MKNVKLVFEEHLPHIVFDQKFLQKVSSYEQKFVNKNETHILFFGGHLMGVHPVRFTDADRNRWFDEILDADEVAIEDDLHALPEILPHRHVSSDVMNLSCIWLAHGFLTSDKLNAHDRHKGAMASILVVQYKFITSILADWFPWDADPIVAEATYTILTKRFGLKILGSWGALLHQRAEDVVSQGKLHYNRLIKMDNDKDVVYMANDIQGRIKDILKNIRDAFTVAQNSPELQIKSISSTIELDGEMKIRDKQRKVPEYIRYILTTIQDKNAFIVPDLVDVIMKAIPAMPRSALVSTLTYMSNNASPKADKRVERVCTIVLQHAFDYLARNPDVMTSKSDIPGLLRKMKSLYQASRTNNPLIMEMRSSTEAMVKVAIKTTSTNLVASVRNAVLLYVLLRAFTMQHYR